MVGQTPTSLTVLGLDEMGEATAPQLAPKAAEKIDTRPAFPMGLFSASVLHAPG